MRESVAVQVASSNVRKVDEYVKCCPVTESKLDECDKKGEMRVKVRSLKVCSAR